MSTNNSPPAVIDRKRLLLNRIIIVLLTIGGVCSFYTKLKGITQDTPCAVYGIDFISYYTAAQLIKEGKGSAIYAELTNDFSTVSSGTFLETAQKAGFHSTPTRYLYLPVFLAPFSWFTQFSFPTAAHLWLSINSIAIILVIILQWQIAKGLPHPVLRLLLLIALNLASYPLFYALKLGQTTIIVYLLMCLIYWLSLHNREVLSGIFLGIITALKFSPLLFIVYFLYRKRYRLVLSSCLTILLLLAISLLTYGLPLHIRYWNYLTKLSGVGIAAWSNQSIDAFMLRLSTKESILHFYPLRTPLFISLLRYLIALSVIGTVFFSLGGKEKRNCTRLYPLEFSALTLCLLITPAISWLHYFTLVNLAIILMVTAYVHLPHYRRWFVLPLVLLGYAMSAFHLDWISLIELFGQGYVTRLLTSFPTIGSCLLLAVNLSLIKTSRTVFTP